MLAFASGSDINTATESTAQQQSNMQNAINIGGTPAEQTVRYQGGYEVKNAPNAYAPGLTASATETCMGSVSGSISGMGFGVAGGATVKDEGCNRRLTASVAWKMDRKDIAFNVMCQEPVFREAAALTSTPCPVIVTPQSAPIEAFKY